MRVWPSVRNGRWLTDVLEDRAAAAYWGRIFDETYAEKNTSWAYRWTFAAWVQGGLTILPNANLVSNIGFGDDATHTANSSDPMAALPHEDLDFPLRHPPFMIRDARADAFTQEALFRSPPLWRRALGAAVRPLIRHDG
jgi:hypothetical protein